MGAETGATAAQIEAAARLAQADSAGKSWESITDLERDYWFALARESARHLVPPGYRIVGPDAVVLDAEQAKLAWEAAREMAAQFDTKANGTTWGIVTGEMYRESASRYWALAEVLNGNG